MAERKFLDFTGLEQYDELIKSVISSGDDAVKSSITNGTITVAEATHATTADSATTATSADSATVAETANAVAWANVTDKPDTYAPSAHNHDDTYYTETEIDAKIEALNTAIDGKAASDHTHDDIYYTKTEIDAMEFITTDDIDTICGSSIVAASEVTF